MCRGGFCSGETPLLREVEGGAGQRGDQLPTICCSSRQKQHNGDRKKTKQSRECKNAHKRFDQHQDQFPPLCLPLRCELLPSPSSQAKRSVGRGGILLPPLTEPNQHSSAALSSVNGPRDKDRRCAPPRTRRRSRVEAYRPPSPSHREARSTWGSCCCRRLLSCSFTSPRVSSD